MVNALRISEGKDLLTLRTVHKYNQLMKDFPLNDLLSATDLDKIQDPADLPLNGEIAHADVLDPERKESHAYLIVPVLEPHHSTLLYHSCFVSRVLVLGPPHCSTY